MTKKLNKIKYSRIKARRLFKDKYCIGDLQSKVHVHHKDKNPLNNDLDNLELLTASQHMKLHNTGITRFDLNKEIKELQSWIIIYNNFYAQ